MGLYVHISYPFVCYIIPKKTRVVLKVFSKTKIRFYSIKGSRQVQTSHSKNCPNCVEEFLVVNIYSLKKTKYQNIIIFNCDVVSIVLVIVILILIWHKRFLMECTIVPSGQTVIAGSTSLR